MPRVDAPLPPVRAPRLAVLDGLRLVAALAVASYHYTVSWRIDGVHPPAYFLPTASHVTIYGFLGVELFFMISGFVICMSSWGRRLGDFFTSRVSRLYPAYWVCIVITLAVVTVMPVVGGVFDNPQLGLTDVMVNLTMLQEPLGVPHVDGVYWTLFVELRFYLLFAVLMRFGLTYRRAVIFCAGWMTVAVLAPMADSRLLTAVAIPDYAPYFIAGIALFLIHKFGPSPVLFAIVGFAWLVCLQRVELRVLDVNPGFAVPTWPGALLITLFFAVLLVIALGWTDRITWRWLTVAGVLTYPFYLLHQRIGYSVIRTAERHTDLPVWLILVLTVALVAVVAWLVHRTVERPLSKVVRSAMQRGLADIRRTESAGPPPDVVAAPDPAPVRPAGTRPPRPERLRTGPPRR